MVPVAAAGAIASGLGQIAGNYIAGKSAEKAAQIQADSANRAIALQSQIYGETKDAYKPFVEAGSRGLTGFEDAIQNYNQPTLGYTQKEFNLSNWQDPGYDFRLAQAKKAIDASTAAKGMTLGSGALKSLQTRSQDMASQEYANSYDRWLKDSNLKYGQASDQYNRDIGFENQNISNFGNLSKVGSDALGNLAGFGSSYGKTAGDMMTGIGDVQAQNAIAQGKSWSNSANLMGSGLSSFLEDYFANTGSTNNKTLAGSTGSTDAASSSSSNVA